MSALLSLRDLVDWEKISACVTAMAHVTHQQQDRSYSLVLQGFEALLLLQGTSATQARACLSTLVCTSMLQLLPMQGCHCNPCRGPRTCRPVTFMAYECELSWLNWMACKRHPCVSALLSLLKLTCLADGKLQYSLVFLRWCPEHVGRQGAESGNGRGYSSGSLYPGTLCPENQACRM